MNSPDRLEVVKILLLGDTKVGKTSFLYRYATNRFLENYQSTLFYDCFEKELNEHGGQRTRIKIQLWDIAGQQRYPLLTKSYYRYTRGCIIMFDLTDPKSFENVKWWKENLDANTVDEYYAPIPCLLVANKLDLSPASVTVGQIEEMCQDLLFAQWTQISVKDGTNVNEAVAYLLDVVLGLSPNIYRRSEYEIIDHIQLADYVERPQKKPCRACT